MSQNKRIHSYDAYFTARTPAVVGDLPSININLMRRRVYVKSWVQHAIRTVRCVHEVLARLRLMQVIYEGIGGMMLQEIDSYTWGKKRRVMKSKINTWFADHIVFFETALSLCYGPCTCCVESE